jgi:hypothetical protein
VAVAGSYYPGYSAGLQGYAMWLDAVWMGIVHTRDLNRPEVKTVAETLDDLVKTGMVSRRPIVNGYQYALTLQAMPYFYDSNLYGNNPDHLPYLCYSTIVPQRILWKQHIHFERAPRDRKAMPVFRASFQWTTSPAAAWARDPVIQAHSVVLAPTGSPTTGKFTYFGNSWHLVHIYNRGWMMPATVRELGAI